MTIRNINISSTAAVATSKLAADSGITSSHLTATLRQGFIGLDLAGGKLWDSTNNIGGLLSTATAPKLDVLSTGQSSVSIPSVQWSSAQVVGVIWGSYMLPPDLSTVDGLSVRISVSKSSNTDTAATFEVAAISPTLYSTVASSKIDVTAFTTYVVAISSANTPAANTPFALRLTPSAHANDSIRLHGVSVTYTRI